MKFILIATAILAFVSCNKKEAPKKTENAVTKSVAKKVAALEKAKVTAKKLQKDLDTNSKKAGEILNDGKKKNNRINEKEFYKIVYTISDALVNQDTTFTLKVTPKKDHHINDGFPVSVKLNDGCFKFAKTKFKKDDAKKLDAKELLFELKGKCDKKGMNILEGTISFGHCTDEICSTAKEGFKFNLNVK